jgi:hypothetical protein
MSEQKGSQKQPAPKEEHQDREGIAQGADDCDSPGARQRPLWPDLSIDVRSRRGVVSVHGHRENPIRT